LKIIDRDLKKGYVEVMVENENDLWILYNVIEKNDIVRAKTTREVKFEGSKTSRRIPMTISLRVENVEYQAFTDRLRITGVVIDAPEEFGVKGRYHTINVEPGSTITIWKEEWFEHQLKMLENSTRYYSKILIVVLDYDEACLALLSDQGVKIIDEIYSQIPGKNDIESYTGYLNKYVETLTSRILAEAGKYSVDVIVVASPGDLAKDIGERVKDRVSRVFIDKVSIGGCSGLNELLRRDSIRRAVMELSILEAYGIMELFKEYIVKDPDMVAYGLNDVEYAVRSNAVDKMIVSSNLLRSTDEDVRFKTFSILDEAYKRGAKIIILPRDTDITSEVEGFGGIIAILRFKLYRFNQPGL